MRVYVCPVLINTSSEWNDFFIVTKKLCRIVIKVVNLFEQLRSSHVEGIVVHPVGPRFIVKELQKCNDSEAKNVLNQKQQRPILT